jgi:predicted acylesterase/phospholipase RssA
MREAGRFGTHHRPRVGVVLSAGGLRGAAHLGVLRRLIAARVPIDVIVGSSAGAIVGGFHAAVGLTIDQMIDDAPYMFGRHVALYGVSRRTPERVSRWLRHRCGIVPDRLAALDRASFDRLHHGVTGFGVVCHDLATRRPCYFSNVDAQGIAVGTAVRASAAIPALFPPARVTAGGRQLKLADGGLSDPLPVEFARRRELGATHLIISDCRRNRRVEGRGGHDERVVHVRPRLRGFGVVPAVSFSVVEAVRAGEEAVDDGTIARIRSWFAAGGMQPGGIPASSASASAGSR